MDTYSLLMNRARRRAELIRIGIITRSEWTVSGTRSTTITFLIFRWWWEREGWGFKAMFKNRIDSQRWTAAQVGLIDSGIADWCFRLSLWRRPSKAWQEDLYSNTWKSSCWHVKLQVVHKTIPFYTNLKFTTLKSQVLPPIFKCFRVDPSVCFTSSKLNGGVLQFKSNLI